MRYTRAATDARANLAAVREMRASTESAITHANLTSRLDGLEEELRRAEAQAACLAEESQAKRHRARLREAVVCRAGLCSG